MTSPESARDSAAVPAGAGRARLRAFVAAHLIRPDPVQKPGPAQLLQVLRERHGDNLCAVLIYGSFLRGKRDTVLDFYVLLDDYRSLPRRWHGALCRLLPPNIYQVAAGEGQAQVRAKCATLSLARFLRGLRGDFHSYFWARFAQPCGLLYCRDEPTRQRLLDGLADAACTFAGHALALLPERFDARALWVEGLTRTYRCELRSERAGYAAGLFDASPDYYRALTGHLAEAGLPCRAEPGVPDAYRSWLSPRRRRLAQPAWWLRAVQGKALSVARLAKAALTFDQPLDYLLWKIGRHSGIQIEPSPRQRRWPLLFAWPLLWRLYRRGAFR